MTKEELIARLKEIDKNPDTEDAHVQADSALLAYIGDEEIAEAYDAIGKWYA